MSLVATSRAEPDYDAPMAASAKRALIGALAANLAVAATKFVVGTLTRSTVMLAEGIHSVVDMGNSGLMLFGGWRSRRPADDAHPFGYGMELYFWSLVVAMVVFGAGGGLSIYEGARTLAHPRVVTHLWPNFLVIGATSIFETISLVIGLREFTAYRRERQFPGSILAVIRASKNPAIFLTVLEDIADLLGLAIAAIALALSHYLGVPELDSIASILIGGVLVLEAILIGIECRGLIIGEAARPLVVDRIRESIMKHGELAALNELRTLQLGPDTILVVLRVRFPAAMLVADLETAAEHLQGELSAVNPAIKHVVFDVRPTDVDER